MSEAADLKRRVESALGQQVSSQVRLGGGCIAVASRMMLADGRVVFAKGGAGAAGFAAEAAGLGELADFGRDDAAAWGSALARLHRRSNGGRKQFGFAQDGMLGSTPQAHGWCDDWITFWRDRRLRPMLDLVQDETVRRLGEAVDARLPELLRGCTAKPSLIHGDLWSGNISQVDGHPTTFDPAAYWADREADFGMIRWMGGLGTAFEEAYTKTWPLEAGSERRILLYELHHHLNHLVLFGASYRNGCIRILQQLLDL